MLSEQLRAAVKLSRVRQYQLARGIGVDPSTLSGWLIGARKVRPGDPRVIALGVMVGVPPDHCFAETETNQRRGGRPEATGSAADGLRG